MKRILVYLTALSRHLMLWRPDVRFRWSSGVRLELWQELAAITRDFEPKKALEIIRDGHSENGLRPNDIVARAAEAWILRLRDGQDFAHAVQGWCSDNERMIIAAGQRTSSLPTVLGKYARFKKPLNKLKSRALLGLIMPALLIVFGWATLVYFAGFTIDFIDQNPDKTPLALQVLWITDLIYYWVSWLVPSLTALLGLVIWLLMVRWLSPTRVALERYWPFSIYKALQAADFLLTYSILKQAGYDESGCLKAIRPNATRYQRWQIDALEANSRDNNWGKTLALSGRRFPDAKLNALMAIFFVNQETYPNNLERIVSEWNESLQTRMEGTTEILLSLVTVAIALIQGVNGLLLAAIAIPQQ